MRTRRDCNGTKWVRFLSGGTDSSTVVGMMDPARRGAVRRRFRSASKTSSLTNSAYAEIAAKKLRRGPLHSIFVSAGRLFRGSAAYGAAFDEPFGNSSAIPTYFCARLAAQNGSQGSAGGDGGDELFAATNAIGPTRSSPTYQDVPAISAK